MRRVRGRARVAIAQHPGYAYGGVPPEGVAVKVTRSGAVPLVGIAVAWSESGPVVFEVKLSSHVELYCPLPWRSTTYPSAAS